jgi:hypothetical protein
MRSVQALLLEENERVLEAVERPDLVLGYELQFLNDNKGQSIHKVEVRSVNFQDVIRHLRNGDSVLITPRLQEGLAKKKKQDGTWYFTHM